MARRRGLEPQKIGQSMDSTLSNRSAQRHHNTDRTSKNSLNFLDRIPLTLFGGWLRRNLQPPPLLALCRLPLCGVGGGL